MLPYGRQSIGDDDVEAVARVLRGDWLTTGPSVDAFERDLAGLDRWRPRGHRHVRHRGAARRLRRGRHRCRRRGRHHADDLRRHRLVRLDARRDGGVRRRRARHRQHRPRRRRGRGHRAHQGRGRRRLLRPPHRHRPAPADHRVGGRAAARGRRALDRLDVQGPGGGVARRHHDVLVLPDEEHDHGRGRRRRGARPRPPAARPSLPHDRPRARRRRAALPGRGPLAPGGPRVRAELPAPRRAVRPRLGAAHPPRGLQGAALGDHPPLRRALWPTSPA